MDYRKTTTLPPDDKVSAQRAFRKLVFDSPYMLAVVLGPGSEAENFVRLASELTGEEHEPRWVVWAQRPEHIEDILRAMKHAELLLPDISQMRGLWTSIRDEIRFVISATDPEPDMVIIQYAFIRAYDPEQPS